MSRRFFSTLLKPAIVEPLLAESAGLVKPGWEKPVGWWLAGSATMVTGMVLVGGYTRLTGAGLSMTDWNLAGRPLPLGQEAWAEEFERYKKFPEYLRLHHNKMTLEEFKAIYFTEWFHRMLGRATGIVFGVPLLGFWAAGALRAPMLRRVGLLGGLGLTQGLVGWWMVKSGLQPELLTDSNKPPRVSSYRMCFHWLMALGLYGGTLWLSWSLLLRRPNVAGLRKLRLAALPATIFAGLTLASGPFVAGNDAGRAYNTWPKMIDDWIPPEVFEAKNDWKRFFQDTPVIQFTHRMLAYSTVLSSLAYGAYASSLLSPKDGLLWKASRAVPLVAALQMTLGITTLLMYVPTELGVAHQAGGLATFTALLLVRFLTKTPI